MDIVKLYEDYSIRSADENSKHYREGWINTECPFCTGNPGHHLGYDLHRNYFVCWRCGHKSTRQALCKLLGVGFREAARIESKYKGRSISSVKKVKVKKKQFRLPNKCLPIMENSYCKKYLVHRGFTLTHIDSLGMRYQLVGTTIISSIDEIDLSYRIIAPILYKDKMVSWQSRDCTGNSVLKYIACPKNREVKFHKEVLYNPPKNKDYIIVCEGIFDVWKVYLAGFNATCCFGVNYSQHQLMELTKYKKVLIFFDPDKAGIKESAKLHKQLLFSGVDATIISNDTDMDAGALGVKNLSRMIAPYV